ncbi:MAG: hypothetical protein RL662_440 [Bacteroidota bacterium]|jgi:hypothetical protein
MKISTSNHTATIHYGKDTFTHALNTLSYTYNDDSKGVTLYQGNNAIGTSSVDDITVNGETLTFNNIHTLLGSLFTSYLASGNPGGATQLPIYARNVASLPSTALIDTLAYITSDGTPHTPASDIYEWDGFMWSLKSFRPNLAFKPRYQYHLEQEGATIKKKEQDGYIYCQVKPVKPQLGAIKLDMGISSAGFPNILEPGNDFTIQYIDVDTIEMETNIQSVSCFDSLNISQGNNDLGKSVSIEDCDFERIYISNQYLKNINIKNIRLVQREYSSTDISVYGGYQMCSIDNIINPVMSLRLHLDFYGNEYPTLESDQQTTLKNITIADAGQLILSGQKDKPSETLITLENIKMGESFNFSYWQLKNLTHTDLDFSACKSIYITDNTFATQAQFDTLLTSIANGMTGGNMDAYRTTLMRNNFTPSASVVDLFASKKINLTI